MISQTSCVGSCKSDNARVMHCLPLFAIGHQSGPWGLGNSRGKIRGYQLAALSTEWAAMSRSILLPSPLPGPGASRRIRLPFNLTTCCPGWSHRHACAVTGLPRSMAAATASLLMLPTSGPMRMISLQGMDLGGSPCMGCDRPDRSSLFYHKVIISRRSPPAH